MKHTALACTATLLLVMFTPGVAITQDEEKPAPEFTLTLSMGERTDAIPPEQQIFEIKLTNTSHKILNLDGCLAFNGMYTLDVIYNGEPVPKTEAFKKYDAWRRKGMCDGSEGASSFKPGESRINYLYYSTTKPGKYEFTVWRDTHPWEPEISRVVRSNTVTLVVPETKDTKTE